MSTKISILEELASILTKKEKMDAGVLHFSKQFKIGQLLKPFSGVKRQGFTLISVVVSLILSRLGGMSAYAMQKTGARMPDDNTMYRLMNNPLVNWKSIVLSFAGQFLRCVSLQGNPAEKAVKCFVIDDTDIEKTGKTFECISKIFSHVTHSYIYGFKMLTLCICDGTSTVPCNFSLHGENKKNEYGLNKKQQKRQFQGKRKEEGYYQDYRKELDEEKCRTAVRMLRGAVRKGILASYVLMDSWFVTDYMLRSIRGIRKGMMHVVGICKQDKRRFEVNGKMYNSRTIIKMNEVKKDTLHLSRRFNSKYMTLVARYNGIPVRLFYIRYKNARKWSLLLTTDLSLSFVNAMELYRIRWNIEVLFKECKQYLRLGKAQNTDFCGQIADAALTLITYTILSLYKRFEDYESLGELFRGTRAEIIGKTLCERIALVFLKIVVDLLEFLCIDVDESLRCLIAAKTSDKRLMILLNAINQLNNNSENLPNVA